MKPDMSQQDFDGLVHRSSELARNTRRMYGLEPPRDGSPSTPFDWMVAGIVRALELIGIAVLIVLMACLALTGGPTP